MTASGGPSTPGATMKEGRAKMAADTTAPEALTTKVEALARLCGILQQAHQRAAAEGGLTQARLGVALSEALLAREGETARSRDLALTGYRAVAARLARPRRRNRIARRIDETLERLGFVGRALLIARSGLWGGEGGRLQRLSAMAAYARRGGDPEARAQALFDQAWYLRRRPDLAGARVSPLTHYLLHGAGEGVDPHPLFDTAYYAERNAAELGATGLSPLEHFVRLGAGEGRDPHPLFDVGYYLRQAPDLIASGRNPLDHYLGSDAGLSPHRLFAPDFYVRQMAAAGVAGTPGLLHYLTTGSALGLKPHPLFDPAWYRGQYPDVGAGGVDPLVHYMKSGAAEGRQPSPWFDPVRYAELRGPALAYGRNPLLDYLEGGAWAISEPDLGATTASFLSAAAELGPGGVTPLELWARRQGDQTPSA